MLTRVQPLDAALRTLVSDCLRSKVEIDVIPLDASVSGCIARTTNLDPALKQSLGRILERASGEVTQEERAAWLSCYERTTDPTPAAAAQPLETCSRLSEMPPLYQTTLPRPAPPDHSLLVLRVLEHRPGSPQLVCPGDRVRSGSDLYLELWAERDIYAQVLAISPSRSARFLYPVEHRELVVRAGARQRVPLNANQVFRLDQTVGRETLLVLAAERPLRQTDASLAALLERVRHTQHVPEDVLLDVDPTRRDGTRTAGEHLLSRGLHLVDLQTQTVSSHADASGLIVAPFVFEHVD